MPALRYTQFGAHGPGRGSPCWVSDSENTTRIPSASTSRSSRSATRWEMEGQEVTRLDSMSGFVSGTGRQSASVSHLPRASSNPPCRLPRLMQPETSRDVPSVR